ncbi:MAG: DNAase [Betaproteobacteria bacterium HGW-Betaproteobacteria-1]|jgi:TatD DNase family protein|nr:MAG: DNAase [Betaproteobacteria bacterium HGW-Betaproteobacteria-1]
MLVDSHCHLNFPELANNLTDIRAAMDAHQVGHALCISVNLREYPQVLAVADAYDNFYATVGVHPDYEDEPPLSVEQLVELARNPKVIGIGETGLDYFRLTGDLEWQRERFRTHIRAAIAVDKPLIIHTRAAADDTLRIMREENASQVGGVMHCFTESLDVALQAIEMGFYISFSGIVTFKNAAALKEVARQIPLDRILVETDSPYLAPVPYRGKTNQPAYVKYVAEEVASLRGIDYETLAEATTRNFFRLFRHAKRCN